MLKDEGCHHYCNSLKYFHLFIRVVQQPGFQKEKSDSKSVGTGETRQQVFEEAGLVLVDSRERCISLNEMPKDMVFMICSE